MRRNLGFGTRPVVHHTIDCKIQLNFEFCNYLKYYKLYIVKKKYRIVYRIMVQHIEVVEIIGIGKRDKEEIYKLVAKRLKIFEKAI